MERVKNDLLAMAPETWIGSIYHPPKAREPWRLDELLACPASYYSLGRWALVDALKASGVRPGDKVLLPGFICRDLLASLYAVKAVPVFYPVSEKLGLSGDLNDFPRARAAIAVNYFGFPQDLGPFREYRRRTGAVLIEDNAHGLFSRDEDGQWLGTRGDLGVFSLRKSMALPNGGALVLHPGSVLVLPPSPLFRKAGGPRWRLKQTFRRATGSWDTRRTFRLLENLRKLGPHNGKAEDDSEVRIPPPPDPCLELSAPLVAADPALEAERRRALYGFCEDLLVREGVQPVFRQLPGRTVPYAFPFFAQAETVPSVQKLLGRHGLRCLPWPDLPRAVEPAAPKHYRNLWLAHFLW